MRIIGLVICISITAASLPRLYGSTVEPRTAVARVNGVPVSSGELDTELDRLAPSSVAAHGKAADSSSLRKKAMEELIIRELAYQKAKQQKLAVTPAEMQAAVTKIKGHYKTEAGFRQALESEQIGEREFLERVEKDLLLRKIYKREIDDKATVTKGEVEAYYRQHRAKFVMPESVRLFQIWADGNRPAAKSRIDEALKKLNSGQPFFDVAYSYSDDDYRVMGGDYGWVHRGQLSPDVEKLAFSAPSRKLMGPMQTSFGWHIMRVDDHRPQRQLPLQEVRATIQQTLHRERLTHLREDLTRRLRENARVEYVKP